MAGEFTRLLDQTNRITALMEAQAVTEVEADRAVEFDRSLDLQQPGLYTWHQETLSLRDSRRNRQILVDLLPA